MTTSFRRPVNVIRRPAGAYVAGIFQTGPEPAPVGILASVQPATLNQDEAMQAASEGRRVSSMFRVYSDSELTIAGEDELPGDIVIHPRTEKRLLVVSKQDWHTLNSSVSHFEYLCVAEIEKADGESPL